MSAYNLYSEEQSIFNANKSLIQQIISSVWQLQATRWRSRHWWSGQGLQFTLLQLCCPLWRGLTASALAPGAISANLNLNSWTRASWTQLQLRLATASSDDQSGTKYPIQTCIVLELGGQCSDIPDCRPGSSAA